MEADNLPSNLKPVISSKALEKSGRVLKALSLLYLPFYNLQPIDLFEYYGTFSFVSAAIYQSDELNECKERTISSSLCELKNFLSYRNLLDDQVSKYINQGETYFILEREFLQNKPESLEEVIKVMRLRSFDFRLLHYLLRHYLNEEYDQLVFDAFATLEILMELDDDIASYEQDSRKKTFNFLWAASLLPQSNIIEMVEEFRSHIYSQIKKYNRVLETINFAGNYNKSVKVYSELVPKPVIPQSFYSSLRETTVKEKQDSTNSL